MKKYWRQIAAGILAAVLLCLWLDIRFGTFSGQRCRLPVLMYHHFVTDQAAEEKEQAGEDPHHVEGHRGGTWILLDFSAVVVHIFNEEARQFYDLERLWSDATPVDLGEILTEN